MSFVSSRRAWLVSAALPFVVRPVAYAATPVRRIVSTAPSITEILFAMGLGDRVVGVSEYCRYPEAATRIQRIGSYLAPNIEVVLSLRPDLVLVEGVSVKALASLPEAGFRKILLNHRDIADIYRSIETIAAATGFEQQGTALAKRIRGDLDRIQKSTARFPRRRVVFIVGRTPGVLQGIIAVGSGTYINEVIAIAGGTNVVADAGPAYPNVSIETILGRNPEVIIDRGDMAQSESQSVAHEAEVRKLWQSLPTIEAVKQNRVFAVSNDYWVVPGPRVVDAALTLARHIHPEAGL